jgi:hypothetical protein
MRTLRQNGDDALQEYVHVANLGQLHQPVSQRLEFGLIIGTQQHRDCIKEMGFKRNYSRGLTNTAISHTGHTKLRSCELSSSLGFGESGEKPLKARSLRLMTTGTPPAKAVPGSGPERLQDSHRLS